MRKFLFLFAVAGLFCAACDSSVETNELNISLGGGTRVGIGDKVNGYYQMYWSPEDRVMCNGEISGEAIISDKRSSLATFTFSEMVVGPFDVVYPAVEGFAPKTPGCYPVRFLAEQHYTEGTFDSAAAPMYKRSSKKSMTLNNLTGTVRLAVKGDVTLSQIVLTTAETPISGIFDVNCKTGKRTLNDGGATPNVVTVVFDEGLKLKSDSATPIFFTLPAGTLGNVDVQIVAENGQKMRFYIDCGSDKPIHAGVVREVKEFEFTNNAGN